MHTHDDGEPQKSDWSRRAFLRAGGLGAFSFATAGLPTLGAPSQAQRQRSVILINLVGGPSQLETFDPKPDAPSEIRGPFGSIQTSVPGVRISEFLPNLAQRMDRLTLIRSLNHQEAPIHETGNQLLHTGALCRTDEDRPHFGSVVSQILGSSKGSPPFVMIPGPIKHTGVAISQGQTSGMLDQSYQPLHTCLGETNHPATGHAFDMAAEQRSMVNAYGKTTLGRACLAARRLVESGTRVVSITMFETVFDRVTWDCHGRRPFSTLDDYRRTLLPDLDRSISTLVDDLRSRGMLDSTLVVATGEFGRSPKLNASGGRDHWPGVWSALLAGGGMPEGQVIGASDSIAAEPYDQPVSPADLTATIYRTLGIDPKAKLALSDDRSLSLVRNALSLV